MKKTISIILLVAMLLTVTASLSLPVFAEKAELDLKWNVGYVGHSTNSYAKNGIQTGSAAWRYTDVFTIPDAGTKITFDLSGKYPTNAVWVFSEWKKSGSDWVLDLDGTNLSGTAGYEYIGQKKNSSGGMSYEFITDHANQQLRICIQVANDAAIPKVYTEASTDSSTRAQLEELDFTAQFNDNGTVTGIKWFCGYASSASNTNGSAKEVKVFSASDTNSYAYSGLIKVPKAGTKISYTLTSSTNNAYNAFTIYKLNGKHYEYFDGYDATSPLVVSNGNTFTYITSEDNEIIRLCCRPNIKYTTVAVAAPVTVKWELTDEPGTGQFPDTELISLVTAAPLVGTEQEVVWLKGYIGSQYKDNVNQRFIFNSNSSYFTTEPFTVPKAGTTVYFFDQSPTTLASYAALTISHWKQVSAQRWEYDSSKVNLTGGDVHSIMMSPYQRSYAYTTTEDNEIIRICVSTPSITGLIEDIPPVFLVERSDFSVEYPEGHGTSLTAGSYTDAAGSKVEFRYFFPDGATQDGKQYTLIFDNSENGEIADGIAKMSSATCIAVAYNGDLATSLRLLDEFCKNCPVKVSDIHFVGGDELAKHLKKYENLRLCQSFIYTGSGELPVFEYAKSKKAGAVDEDINWIFGKAEDYYSVLEGLTMYAIGDSYFGGSSLGTHQTWVNLLGYKYGMTFHNFGIGGDTVTALKADYVAYKKANGVTSMNDKPGMVNRYTELPLDGDIYFIEGGRNDRHYTEVALGNSIKIGENDSTDIYTFKGALNTMINYFREKAPNALIVIVTPWSYKSEGKGVYYGTNDDFADAMRDLVKSRNDSHVVCLYAADVEWTGIDMGNAATRQKYCCTPSDTSHLNADGMNLILPKFDEFIAKEYAALNKLDLINEADNISKVNVVEENNDHGDDDTTADDATTSNSDAPTTETSGCAGCGSISAVASIAVVVTSIFGIAIVRKHK